MTNKKCHPIYFVCMDNGDKVITYPKKKVKQSQNQKRKETASDKMKNTVSHAAKKAEENN